MPQQRHPDVGVGALVIEDVTDHAHNLVPKSFLLHETTLLCFMLKSAAGAL
jgi:hypothetical protein